MLADAGNVTYNNTKIVECKQTCNVPFGHSCTSFIIELMMLILLTLDIVSCVRHCIIIPMGTCRFPLFVTSATLNGRQQLARRLGCGSLSLAE
jgi:hypothetical protein